ncbi:MAG: ABC transporter permease [Acidobacteriota bacterium]
MGEMFRRLRYLVNRRRLDRELGDEMEFHREMAAREGSGPVGNTLRLREEARDAWGWTWIDRLGQDLRYGIRMLRRSPGFSVAAVLMLAIGIGVNVAAFGFINAAFIKPLPVRDPGSLLHFERQSPERYASDLPYPEVAFIRDYARTLSAVLAQARNPLTLEGSERPLAAQFVTGNFFTELGASARIGRVFTPDEDRTGAAAPVVVLSHRFWQRQFGGDGSVVGRSISLNHRPATIIGVVSESFGGLTLDDPDVWVPLSRHPDLIRGSTLLTAFSNDDNGVRMWGRMRPGVTAAAVEHELQSLLQRLRAEHPNDIWEHERLVSEPGGRPGHGGGSSRGSGQRRASKAGPTLAVVGALTLLILAAACGNLGSLLLARGVSRSREIGVRIAVGAGVPRIIRQLFTESLLLAGLGSLAGLGLGQVILRLLMSASGAPTWLDMTPDWRVVAFTISVAFVAAILFGFAPALQVARQRRRSTAIRQILIGVQVAASCVLLIVAGLLVRALDRMITVDPGFAYQQVIAINPGLASHGYSAARAGAYLATMRTRLESLPGVVSVAMASTPPLGGKTTVIEIEIDGRRTAVHVNHVDEQFLTTLGIPLRRGRALGRGDTRSAMVSESLARWLWPGQDPLGKEFDHRTVVGLVGSARQTALQDPDAVEVYFPVEPEVLPSVSMLVKVSGRPEDAVRAVAATAEAIDPDVFAAVEMLQTAFHRKLEVNELTALGVSLLGVSALLLACAGIVGLVAYAVAQHTKEIGIRIALGASGAQVLSVVVRQLSRPVVAGLLTGTGAAAALTQILRRELYGVSHLDPVAYLAAIGVFVGTVAIAAWWPARRALRIDPLNALRID